MKTLFTLLFLCTLHIALYAQDCQRYMRDGNNYFHSTPPKYQKAVDQYMLVIINCPEMSKTAREKIMEVFAEIEQLKIKAEESEKKAITEKRKADIQKLKADSAKVKAEHEEAKAKAALAQAELMQRKVETVMFDKAVKERNEGKDWKGYEKTNEYERNEILEKVDTLNLAENALLRLPKEVAECKNLKHINLLKNPDINWKQSDETLDKLNPQTGLYVSVYDLDSIPKEYHKLITGIEILKTGLTEFPANILEQKQLTSLEFKTDYDNRNKFQLPPKFYQLTNLQYLNLSYCEIDTLPSEIGNLSNLTSLDLGGNQLTTLPPEIGNLSILTSLDLRGNKITTLPPEIRKLSVLTSLNLRGNKITTLPLEIGNLNNLTSLNLNYNHLTTLPPDLWKLSNLKSLGLAGNEFTTLPPEMGKLSNLISLYLSENKLTSLPLEIKNLTNLKELYLDGNNFSETEKQKIIEWLPNCEIYWETAAG